MQENYGKLLYEYNDSVSPLDMTKTRCKKHLKSFMAISNLLCMLLITVWCIWNFVLDLKNYTVSSVIKYYAPLFIVLLIVLLICILSVFGLWGIFLRFITQFYRPHSPESRNNLNELRSDIESYDTRKGKENSIAIYENAIILFVDGKREFIHRSTRYDVKMLTGQSGIYLFFDAEYTGNIEFKCPLPTADSYLLKKYLGDKLTETELSDKNIKPDTVKEKPKKEKRKNYDTVNRVDLPALVIGCVAIFIGIVLTFAGVYDLMNGMPPSAGGFVIIFGLLLICIAFFRFDIVNVFFIKIAVAAMFIYMGIVFLIIIEGAVTKTAVTFSSLLRHPSIYSVCCLFFVSMGISFIPNSIKSLTEYIKYKK